LWLRRRPSNIPDELDEETIDKQMALLRLPMAQDRQQPKVYLLGGISKVLSPFSKGYLDYNTPLKARTKGQRAISWRRSECQR